MKIQITESKTETAEVPVQPKEGSIETVLHQIYSKNSQFEQ